MYSHELPDDSIGQSSIPDIDLPELEPKLLFSMINADIPLLLLPVRLETRFYYNPERLRIRIYPDQIHVNSHQPALSEAEAKLGHRFWELAWDASLGKASRLFGRLSENLGPWRAAWVMDATAPTNLGEIGEGKPDFPALSTGRNPTAPARLALLPQRWFAVGILNGDVMFEEYGNPIPDTLRFAPFQMHDGEDNERWMVDFDLALKIGMALEIRLDGSKSAIVNEGLDELIILGACLDDPNTLAQTLDDVLQSHYYTRGFDFVPQGTPTNNTENVSSPWQWNTADTTDVFRRAMQPTPASVGSFRERFATALGLDVDGIVARASHGDISETPAMEAMNLALWYIMWGEYLRFVLHDGDQAPLSEETIDWVRDWFVGHVRGGAVYPAFQIGSMPYGVLPIQLEPVPLDTRTNTEYLQWMLWQLRDGWERSLPNVLHLDPTATASSTDAAVTTDLEQAHENLVALLSSHPHPVRFFTRRLDNLREGWSGIFFDPVELYELEITILLDAIRDTDLVWSVQIDADLREPFASLEAQIEYFQDMLGEVDGSTQDIVETILMLLEAHAKRVAPVNDLGLPPVMDVLSEATPNPEHFYFHYYDTTTEWGGLPLVQSDDAVDGGTVTVYLDWLHDYARGTVSGTGPEGLPDPAPLLFQLIKQAIDRANKWDGGPLTDLDGFLGELDTINQLGTVAQRVDATGRLMTRQRRVSDTAALLNTALESPQDNLTRQAVSSVPRSVFSNVSKQLREYQQVTRTSTAELDDLTDALDRWTTVPGDGTSLPGTGGSKWIPVTPGARAREIADAITELMNLTPDELELRMTETLGLAMHRLDAWISAYAEQRVDTLRSENPSGIQIGGYGWIENLRPDYLGEPPTQGYIHAPSMTHAAMAAVLRSGYSAYSDGTNTSPMSVDLRSDRVRVASWMMDGVRQGQRINDLLGYRFERYLHDHQLDVWIQPVRDVVASEGTTEMSGATELVTVDGLALLELWDEGRGLLEDRIVAPLNEQGKPRNFDEIIPALDRLVWVTDSMADLALAESVHAILQGDYERASAVQNAAALGDVPPPELRSILTPNSGMTVTHRLLLLPRDEGSAWKDHGLSIRSAMEPALEAWVAGILGEPQRVFYKVTGGPDDPVETHCLAELPLSALDAVYLAPSGGIVSGSGIGSLIAYDYRQRHATADNPISSITIDADFPVVDDQITLHEFILLANSLRRILSGARAATANDFLLGVGENSDDMQGVDIGNFMRRAIGLLERFGAAVDDLSDSEISIEQSLLKVSAFNLPQAIPASQDAETLTAQAVSVQVTAEKRIKDARKALGQLQTKNGEISAGKRIRIAKSVIAAILGRDFPAMMGFEIPIDAASIQSEADLADGDTNTTPVMGWLLKMVRVRPELSALREVITAAEALQNRPMFPFWVVQIPHVADELWAGTTRPNDDGNDRLSVVLTTNGTLSGLTGSIGGLVFDQWIERIPSNYEMTGLTFHFDAPTSRPPQVLLLAMPPEGRPWDFSVARDTVREAFAMTRLRAVAPETLGDYGHQIPAVYMALTLDTIGATNDE